MHIGEICQEVLIPDLLRSIYRRDRIKCLRQGIKLLNNVSLNTGNNAFVVNNTDVHTIIVSTTLSDVVVRYRTWSNCFPENRAINNRQLLWIIPVNSSNCIYTSGIDGRVCNRTICFVEEDVVIWLNRATNRKRCGRIVLSICNSDSSRTNTNSVDSMSPLNIESRIARVSISFNTNNDTFQESSGDGRNGASGSIRNNNTRKTNGNTITNGDAIPARLVVLPNGLVC